MTKLFYAKDKAFKEILRHYDLVWIGEIHGIKENYRAYKTLLPYLIKNGFKNVAWEMRSDFSEKSQNSEDGRINPFSIRFYKWLTDQTRQKKIDTVSIFGTVKIEKNTRGESDYEKQMAKQLLPIIGNTKTIIITGNYHMRNFSGKKDPVKSASAYTEEKSGLKILKINLEYVEGTFYNYSVQKLREHRNTTNREFGTMTQHNGMVIFYVNKAHAVFKSSR